MRRLGLLTVGLLLLSSTGAVAADFTFNVPVTLSNVPSVTQLAVGCGVSRVEAGGVSPFGPGNVVGSGQTAMPVSGGAYSGTVRVEVNASGIISADQARSYSCSLSVVGRARTGAAYTASPGNLQAIYETATGHTLTSVRTTVRGPIPR